MMRLYLLSEEELRAEVEREMVVRERMERYGVFAVMAQTSMTDLEKLGF